MLDGILGLIVDEGKWLTASMSAAFLSVTILYYQSRHGNGPQRKRVMAAMNLFFGVMIGTMAFGHILAVTTKLALGTLVGSLLKFYLIGAALAAPSAWLIYHTRKILIPDDRPDRTALGLNVWMAITLLSMGIHNLPLAAPAFLNIGYQFHSRRMVGLAIVAAAVIFNIGLFVGSLVFLASGQTFEQFRGME